jgi:hypothetical protein
MSQAQPSEKKKCWYACRLFGRNCFKEGAVWHIDPLLGNDHEISNYTLAVTKQWHLKEACFHGSKRIQQ